MNILVVDPGFGRMGVAILTRENGKEKLLYSSCIKTSSRDSFHIRLLCVCSNIRELIKKFNPKALAIETLFFNTNQKTAMNVAEVRGAVIYEALLSNMTIHEYTPLQVKIATTGYGRAPKQQVALMVSKLIKIGGGDKKLDDEFDAIAIGLTYFAHVKDVEH